jgi:hypothetical protein
MPKAEEGSAAEKVGLGLRTQRKKSATRPEKFASEYQARLKKFNNLDSPK